MKGREDCETRWRDCFTILLNHGFADPLQCS